jgi:hypothetical protein
MIRNSQKRKKRTDGDCETIFVLEIRQIGSEWGTTPKVFDSKEEAEKEAERLKKKYPFLDGCRIVSRKIEEKSDKD